LIALAAMLPGSSSAADRAERAQAALAHPAADPDAAFLARNRRAKGVVETPSGLQYQVLARGPGETKPTDQDVALINYEGRLIDGTTGREGVVPGFSEALKLMTKGARYRFWIKPSLGYGDKLTGPIPAHSVLVFDVELLDFLPETALRQMMQDQQAGDPNMAQPGTSRPQ
jgi:FKBP-type peptidyl-prolyl cis-trans isomerase